MNDLNHAIPLGAQSLDEEFVRDDELISAARVGSPDAFEELYAMYSRRLYKTIIAITKSPEDAEDALQDAFLRAYLGIGTFEGRSSIYSWLTRIGINSALMILRRRRNRPEVLFEAPTDGRGDGSWFEFKDTAPSPEEICDLRQQRTRILRAIDRLDPTLRTPMQIRVTQGWSIKQIGRAMNISEVAVKTRLHRARRRLLTVRDVKH